MMGASHAVFPLAHDHHPTANSGEGSPQADDARTRPRGGQRSGNLHGASAAMVQQRNVLTFRGSDRRPGKGIVQRPVPRFAEGSPREPQAEDSLSSFLAL